MGSWILLLAGVCSLVIQLQSNLARFPGRRSNIGISLGAVQTRSEQLVVHGPDGTVIATAEGDEHRVPIDPKLDRLLQTPGAHVTLTHTHPAGTGPSGADLGQLAKPGLKAIRVEGADGSLYRAAAGPRYDAAHFEDEQYPAARSEIERQLRLELRCTPRADLDAHFSHLVATSLDKAGVIRYLAVLSAQRAETYRLDRVAFGRATEAAAAAVRRLPLRAGR
jgi:hypothetical protein